MRFTFIAFGLGVTACNSSSSEGSPASDAVNAEIQYRAARVA